MRKLLLFVAVVAFAAGCGNKTQNAGNSTEAAETSPNDTMRAYNDDAKFNKDFDINKYLPTMKELTAKEQAVEVYEISFDEYGLLDIDRDGLPEVFLQNGEGFYSAVFSLAGGKPDLLAHSWGATSVYFFENGVGVQGGCGTGCFISDCTILKDSKALVNFCTVEECNMEGDFVSSTNTKDGEQVATEEIEKLRLQLGEQLDLHPIMHKIISEDMFSEDYLYGWIVRVFDKVNEVWSRQEVHQEELDTAFFARSYLDLKAQVLKAQEGKDFDNIFFIEYMPFTQGLRVPIRLNTVKVNLLTGNIAEINFDISDQNGDEVKMWWHLDFENGQWRIDDYKDDPEDQQTYVGRMEEYLRGNNNNLNQYAE